MSQIKTIFLGRAHDALVKGKGSPAALFPQRYSEDKDFQFREYAWSEEMCQRVYDLIINNPEIIDRDIDVRFVYAPGENEPTKEEMRQRLNVPNALVHWHHVNAAGMGDVWKTAQGFSIWTARGHSPSDAFAQVFFDTFTKRFPDFPVRQDRRDGDSDYEANFTANMFRPFSFLTETGFQDNKKDLKMIMSEEFKIEYGLCCDEAYTKIVKMTY